MEKRAIVAAQSIRFRRCSQYGIGFPGTYTTPNGAVIKEIRRDSFGIPYYDSFPDFHLPIGFAGGLTDPDTGLVRFGWRDYDPTIGRFTALDPARDRRGDGDLYDYCMDDPVSRVDPTGLWSKENFDESKVSRDGLGQFASKPGSGAGSGSGEGGGNSAILVADAGATATDVPGWLVAANSGKKSGQTTTDQIPGGKAVEAVIRKYEAMADGKRDMEELHKDLQTAINGIPGLDEARKAALLAEVEKRFNKQFRDWSYASRMAHRKDYETVRAKYGETLKQSELTEAQIFADVDGFMDTEYRKARWDPQKDGWWGAEKEERTHFAERSRLLGEKAKQFSETPEGRRKIMDERAAFATPDVEKWQEELSEFRLYHLDRAEKRAMRKAKTAEDRARVKDKFEARRTAIRGESAHYMNSAIDCAREYGLQPSLVLGLMWRESEGDPDRVSPAKAIGLMQVQSDTASEVKKYYANSQEMNSYVRKDGTIGYVKDLNINKPEDNIRLGALALRMYMEQYNGDAPTALNRYNGKKRDVEKADGDFNKLRDETQRHQRGIEDKMRTVDGNPLPKSSLFFYLPKKERDALYNSPRITTR